MNRLGCHARVTTCHTFISHLASQRVSALWQSTEDVAPSPLLPKWDGWHFAADDEGCNSLLASFDLMEHAQYPNRVTLPLTRPPNEVLNVPNRQVDLARPAASWTLGFSNEWDADLWELSGDLPGVSLRFGRYALPNLRKGVRDSLKGDGDYANCEGWCHIFIRPLSSPVSFLRSTKN